MIIKKYIIDKEVAYLKREDDDWYIINVESIYDFGNVFWFTAEATDEENAIELFNSFINIWFKTPKDVTNYIAIKNISVFDILDNLNIHLLYPILDNYY